LDALGYGAYHTTHPILRWRDPEIVNQQELESKMVPGPDLEFLKDIYNQVYGGGGSTNAPAGMSQQYDQDALNAVNAVNKRRR
jgi:hypothetical protein